jgi:hypothetical protein
VFWLRIIGALLLVAVGALLSMLEYVRRRSAM